MIKVVKYFDSTQYQHKDWFLPTANIFDITSH